MTPKERICAALDRREPDRVPVTEMGIDWKVMAGFGFVKYFDFVDALDLDAVPVNQYIYHMGYRKLYFRYAKTYIDEWGVGRKLAGELLPVPVSHPISLIEELKSYKPPSPKGNPLIKAVKALRKRFPERALMVMLRVDFAAAWYLCGMDTLLMCYFDQPEFAQSLARMITEYSKELVASLTKAGTDIITLTDDYGYKTGCIMSPEQFRDFILPSLTEVVHAVKQEGAYCIKHTDGDVGQILGMIVDTGIDGLGPLEPGAGMDLREIKRDYGSKVAVVGNVDVDLLSRGTAAEVTAVTRGLVTDVSPGGGYILSSGNSISSTVKPENYRAMLAAARE